MPDQHQSACRLLCVALLCVAALAATAQTLAQTGEDEEDDEDRIEALYTAGRFDDAIRLAQKVVADTERALGPKHADVAEALQTLGKLYIVTHRHGGAELSFRRALTILEGDPDADSGDVALALGGLASAYHQTGRYAEAEPLLKRALSLLELEAPTDVEPTDIAELLHNLGTLYHDTGRYAEAEPLFKRAVSIYEAESGVGETDVRRALAAIAVVGVARIPDEYAGPLGASLNGLGGVYYQTGRYAEAEHAFGRAAGLLEAAFGPEHPHLAQVFSNLAALYGETAQYAKAEPLHRRAVSAYEKMLGPESPETALAINNQATLYLRMGQQGKAEELFQRALSIYEKTYGPAHSGFARALLNLAGAYFLAGQYAKAEAAAQRAISVYEKALGPAHPDVAKARQNLAVLYRDTGQYAKAELLLQRAAADAEKALGAGHPAVAQVLNNLGMMYRETGRYAEADLLHRRVLSIYVKALGPEHPSVAEAHHTLALLYAVMGRYGEAESAYLRAVAVYEKAFGREHVNLASALNGLASLYQTTGRAAEAEPVLRRSLGIFEKALGPQHPGVAYTTHNLAMLYHLAGRYAEAERLYQRAASVIEAAFGPAHASNAQALNSLGILHLETGRHAEAARLLERSIALYEKALGPAHPEVARGLNNLGVIHQMGGDYEQAWAYYARGGEVRERSLAPILASGSEQQKQLYVATLAFETNLSVSFHVRSRPSDPRAGQLALTTILRRKGRALDAMTDQLAALRRRSTPEDQVLLDRLAATLARLANLQLSNGNKLAPEARSAEIARLSAQKEQLEDDISRRSAEFRAAALPVTLDAVRLALPPDAALVEMFVYQPFDPGAKGGQRAFGSPRYVAYVLRREDAAPQWVDLGDAAGIDSLAEPLLAALRDPAREDFKQLARALDERLTLPIRKLLGPTRRIFLAPDGALNLIPFAALVDENGQYLIENYSISYLTSGRDLLRLQIRGESREAPRAFADPLYDMATPTAPRPDAALRPPSAPALDNRLSIDFTAMVYKPLPGTATEAAVLSTLFADTILLTGAQATEAALKKTNRPRMLHIATHGFFLADRQRTPAEGGTRELLHPLTPEATPPPTANGENTLLRSGLILAGVKQLASGLGEDGVLTALEVVGLDLWGTKLVVLSACETGLGVVKNGEGVYGLRRALILAGSETQVMSLWKVSDAGTRDLIVTYYKLLQQGAGRTEALRQVQMLMLRGELMPSAPSARVAPKDHSEVVHDGGRPPAKDYSHPFYWASFIPSGDWHSLTGR